MSASRRLLLVSVLIPALTGSMVTSGAEAGVETVTVRLEEARCFS
jgi:hypothetical protein